MSEKTYVVAGNYDEFLFNVKNKLQRLYAEGDTRFTMSDFVYVSSVDKLRGLSTIKGYYYGSYMKRPDIAEIQNMINMIKTRFPNIISTSTPTISGIDIERIWLDEISTQLDNDFAQNLRT